jgi:hypothetical protein
VCHNHRRPITRRYFTKSWKKITGVCHNHWRSFWRFYRRILPTDSPTEYPHPEAHACQTRVRRADVPTEFPTDRKVWRDFRNFLVRISINCRRNYRRNLIPPTTINVRRKNCHIKHPIPPIWFIFFSRLSFSSSPFLFSSPVAFGFLKRFSYFGGSFKRYVFFFLYLCIFFILIMIIFFGALRFVYCL